MSLLQLLNLPQPKYLALVQGRPSISPRATAPVASGAAEPHGAKPAEAKGANGGGDADVLAEAKKARGAIEAHEKEARETLIRFNKLSPLLDQKIAAATGDAKKKLLEQKGQFDKKTAEAVKTVDQARADLEAIDNPASGREELVGIMARHRSSGKVAEEMEISSPGLDSTKKKVNHDVTTTTTSYEKGRATSETEHDKRRVGMNGVTREHSTEKVVQTADSTARNSEEKKSHVSLTGKVSVETKKSAEIELADGRKSSAEHSTAKEISAKGAEKSETHKVTNLDGSSAATTKKQGVERGEGKVTATTSTSVTQTSKTGTAHTTDKSASGGLIAGKDGVGAQGGVDGGKKITSKGGRQAGVVAGLHASVVCNVGEPSGEPRKYPVTLTVTFGVSAGASAGGGKQEGSKKSVGVEVKGSLEASMTVKHLLTEEQLGGYEKALQAASKGSKVAATEQEFAIIAAGARGQWDVARNLWAATNGAISAKTADQVKNVGDSVKLEQTKTGSISGDAKVGPVGVGGGVKVVDQKSKTVTRTDANTLDVDGKSSHTKETSKSLSLNTGAFEVKVGTVTTHTTSFGYVIDIDDKNDPGHKLLAELGRCETEGQYQAFLAKYEGKAKLVSHTTGKKDGESDETGVSVLGKGIKFGTGQSVSEEETRDGKGKLVSKTVIGEEHAGGSLSVLGHDSKDEQAKAVIDGDGNAEVTLTRTTSANDGKNQIAKRLKKVAEKYTGGDEDDSTTHDVEGLILTNADLKKIGGVACRSLPAWNGVPRRYQENEDWAKAGIAIKRGKGAPAIVAEQLARFIGGDRVERMKTVEQWVRGGYHATMGHAFEFPDSLSDLQADYNEVVADSLPEKMDIMANKQGNAAATQECKRLAAAADRIEPRLRKCDEFKNEATKTEMLSRLSNRRQLLAEAIKGYGGLGDKASEDPKVLEEKCDRLMKLCSAYFVEQSRISGELHDSDTITVAEKNDVRKLIKKLEDLQLRWWGDWRLMKETFVKRKVPMPDLPMFRPDESIVAIYEKKIGD